MASWSEIEIFINSQIASAGHLKRTVLGADEELPEVNKADIDTIYMKPYANGVVSDFYEEYMVINGAWEIIGNTFVDLSNYLQEITVGQGLKVTNKNHIEIDTDVVFVLNGGTSTSII